MREIGGSVGVANQTSVCGSDLGVRAVSRGALDFQSRLWPASPVRRPGGSTRPSCLGCLPSKYRVGNLGNGLMTIMPSAILNARYWPFLMSRSAANSNGMTTERDPPFSWTRLSLVRSSMHPVRGLDKRGQAIPPVRSHDRTCVAHGPAAR